MRTVDGTPPADFPAQCIILDREFAVRHPDKGFYLRVQVDSNTIAHVELTGAYALTTAKAMAKEKGYAPTHWMEVRDRTPWKF